MKFLVTGGAGFIGHNIVRQLEKHSNQICILDNFTDYGIIPSEEILPLHQERLSRISTQQIHRLDIRDRDGVFNIFEEFQPDIVVHCAAYPRARAVDLNPVTGSQVLTTGLINLLHASDVFSVRRFVYVSSSMVYGDFYNLAYEDMPCQPKGIYGILKFAGEQLTRDICNRADIDYVILRPSAVYGPRDVTDRVVSRFLQAARANDTIRVRGARERLDFTHVDDTVDGIVRASLSFNSSRRTYNITRGQSRTLLEAAELAQSIAGGGTIQLLEPDPAFPSRGTLSNIQAGKDFGYQGTIDIEQGFKDYYDWITNSVLWNQ
mgnify:FL=1